MTMTREEALKYLKSDGTVCPLCGSNDISACELEAESSEVIQEVNCEACGGSWSDIFKLAAVADEDGETVASIAIEAETL
jgi:transcription elongation factor Elf1